MSRRRPLLFVALFLVCGILIGEKIHVYFRYLVFGQVLFLIFSVLTISRKKISTVFVLLNFLLMGLVLIHQARRLPHDHVTHVARYYRKQPVLVEGIVISDIQRKFLFKTPKNVFTLSVSRIKSPWGWKQKSGRLLVQVFRDSGLHYGDHIILQGKLHRAFEDKENSSFSYRDYLARKGIQNVLSVKKDGFLKVMASRRGSAFKRFSLSVKQKLKSIFDEHLTANESGLMKALLLGDRDGIPDHISDLFMQTGTAHILAISGLHIGIIAFCLFLLLRATLLPRRIQYLVIMCFLIFYAFLTGARPSVVRATTMAVIFLMGFLLEREVDGLNSLCFAVILLLLFNPFLLFDIGFQMSFASVFSIIMFFPKLRDYAAKWPLIHRYKVTQGLWQLIAVSFSAWIGVAGLIAYYFKIITPVTIIANLIIIPLVVGVVALGLSMLVSGLIIPNIVFLFAMCLKVVLNLMAVVIYFLTYLPFSFIRLTRVPFRAVFVYYGLLIGMLFLMIRKGQIDKKSKV